MNIDIPERRPVADAVTSTRDRLRKYWRLSWADRRLLFQAALQTGLVSLGMRVLPFSFWRHRLQNCPGRPQGPAGSDSPDRILWAVSVAAGFVPGATCLVRSLVARDMLCRAGHTAELRLGVNPRVERPLQAHAWLECEGRVLLGGEDVSTYTRLRAPAVNRPREAQKS